MQRKYIQLLGLLVLSVNFHTHAQSYFPQKNDPHIKVPDKIPVKAYAFPLEAVRLTDSSPFKRAMQVNNAYLNMLKADRLLHRFRLYAGLTPKDSLYECWESLGVSGFTLGHYLSALALTYATTGEQQYKQKAQYIVDELLTCQKARGDGYVGAIPEQDRIFDEVASGKIRSQGFDLNGGWVPWYTVHKLLAGLLDVYLYTNNEKALAITEGVANWLIKSSRIYQKNSFKKC